MPSQSVPVEQKISIREAARRLGVTHPAISKAIRVGRISPPRNGFLDWDTLDREWPKDPWISMREAAHRLGVSSAAVWHAIRRGRLSPPNDDGRLDWNVVKSEWGTADFKRFLVENASALEQLFQKWSVRNTSSGDDAFVRKYHGDGTVTRKAIRQLLSESIECPYCGDPYLESKRSLDHLIPVSKATSGLSVHSIGNIVVCCKMCNSRKSATPVAKFLREMKEKRLALLRAAG